MIEVVKITARVGDREPQTFNGRVAWALDQLVRSGDAGCTPIDQPAPRWSDYVFKLRRQGVVVQTIDEKHGGAFTGYHARYRLASPVEVISTEVKP
jgi:hypothetical protein